MSERASVTRPLEDALRVALPHAVVMRLNSGTARSASGRGRIRLAPTGSPDLMIIHRINGGSGGSVVIGIETKRPGGQLRPSQVAMRQRWEAAGGIWLTVESVAQGRREVREVLG